MHSIACPTPAGVTGAAQMILIPGAYHSAQDFLRQGFASAVAKRGLSLDLRLVDLEMKHLSDRDGLEQLRTRIILPARSGGAAVWLGGISLGALAALDYASAYPGEVAGLCLLAPYLGNRMLVNEIAAAGLRGWQAGALAESDVERRVWTYLKVRPDPAPIFLGYGKQDRFSAAHELLAAALPADWVERVEGGHDWPAWLKLWEKYLDSHFT